MKKYILLFLCLMLIVLVAAQQSIGINTTTPHPNASLDIKGVNKGLLIPRGDVATRNVLNSNTAKGLMMYDTMTNLIWLHNGNGLATGWQSLSTGTNHWSLSGALGTEIANTNTGGFWSANPTSVFSDPGIIQPPVSGPGTRLMWMPGKSAFRACTTGDTTMNANNIGTYSFATGVNTIAKGSVSVAMGNLCKATGENSIALGFNSTASDIRAVAIGYSCMSSGYGSFSTGWASEASGDYSTALGGGKARGYFSCAAGAENKASGTYSTALGLSTVSKGYGAVVVGMYNDSILTIDQNFVTPTTPVFIVGNGDGIEPGERKNAMVIRKDGRIGIGTNVPVTLMHVDAGASASDGFLVQGDYNASATVPDLYGSNRMTFFPAKGAFRAGRVTGTQWNNSNTGSNSTGLGFNTIASGLYSFAAGDGAVASSQNTFAAGYETKASGTFSLAMGYRNKAAGSVSNVMGYYNIAKGFSSTVVGIYNDSILGYNQGFFESTTPLFIIGNGDGDAVGQRHNAMVVRKDGHVGIGTNSPFTLVDIHANSIGQSEGFMVRGDYYSGASTINMGAGNRMTFFPGKGVFRAGGVSGTQWDDDNAGEYSVAMGLNSKASGAYSVAIGPNAVATGMSSYALGSSSLASGSEAIAFGVLTKAIGARSSSFGSQNISKSYAEVAIGQYNDTLLVTAPNSGVWESNDALLVGGNGTGIGTRSNAFVFYKNGNADINGYTQLGKTSEAAPSIKMKKLTGVTNIAQNAWTNIPHGLTKSKILSVDILVSIAGWVNLPPGYTHDPGYEYQYHIADAYIVVINTNGNSGNMLNKPITILITYEE